MEEIKTQLVAWQIQRNKKTQKLIGSLQMTKHGSNLKDFIRQFQINTTLEHNPMKC